MTNKLYWHELTIQQQRDFFNATENFYDRWTELQANFDQPQWCGHIHGLDGTRGCGLLILNIVSNRTMVITENFCKNCMLYAQIRQNDEQTDEQAFDYIPQCHRKN